MLWRTFDALFRKVFGYPIRRHLYALEAATHRPRETQVTLLRQLISRQAATDFGRDHRFATIRTVDDFRRQLPVSRYEYFEPYIARVRRGETRALLADRLVHMFALTSGTTSARKYIPVTPRYLADYRRGWNIWGLKVYRDHRSVLLRPILQLSSDHDEFRTEAGIPCGNVSGLTATMQSRIIRWVYCMPGAAGRIKDTPAKYYTALRLSLHRKLGMLITANPSSLLSLARYGDGQKESLIRDLFDGTLKADLPIPADVRVAITRRLSRRPERARELEAIVSRTGTLYPKDYWPADLVLGNWTGGSVGAYLRQFPTYFGAATVRDIGLIASEGRMSIPLADHTASGVLDVTSHYFEFIPEHEVDSPAPTVLGAHELEAGRAYYIVPTTAFGLYRYHIFDLVRVTGFHNRTPLIEFLSKGSHFANITGEKLSEYHVSHAVRDALGTLQTTLGTYSLAPCWSDDQPYYGLFVERDDLPGPAARKLAEAIDRRLGELNDEYAAKRASLRLGPVRPVFLPPGAWHQWDRQRLARSGGSPEQYKHPCLIPDLNLRDSLPAEQDVA